MEIPIATHNYSTAMIDFADHAERYDAELGQSIGISGYSADNALIPKLELCREIWLRRSEKRSLSFLDFGCGPGRVAVHFRTYFGQSAEYLGVDVSSAMIDLARRHYPPPFRFETFQPPNLPDEPRRFDLALVSGVFHHIDHERHEGLLAGIRDRLAGEGSLVIWEHNPLNPVTRWIVRRCPFDRDAHLVEAGRMKEKVRMAGFTRINLSYRAFLPFRFRRADRHLTWCPLGGQYSIEASL